MRKEREIPPVQQLELELSVADAVNINTKAEVKDNVVHVQFGAPKFDGKRDAPDDQALVELILQSAQRLKW